jgi:hypothetical protein
VVDFKQALRIRFNRWHLPLTDSPNGVPSGRS